jgi:hypothetical protein
VRNRQYLDAICEFLEYNVVRKSSDRQSPRAAGDGWNPFAGSRRFFDVLESLEYLRDVPIGSRRIPLTIPICRLAKLLARGGLDDYSFQR